MTQIPVDLVVEDELSEAVARRALDCTGKPFLVGAAYGKTGFGYLKKRILGFNKAAKSTPYLVLTDLDKSSCPPDLITDWFGQTQRHPNLLFRVAVREVEAWLLAHREAFARFCGIAAKNIPKNVDQIEDAKQFLIRLVSKSKRRTVREDIVPSRTSFAKQGPAYNLRMTEFVNRHWDPRIASKCSESLSRTLSALDRFFPTWLTSGN
ncbi:MAG: hypothetical protein AABZ47_16325 [Planctomycetota bacterium]